MRIFRALNWRSLCLPIELVDRSRIEVQTAAVSLLLELVNKANNKLWMIFPSDAICWFISNDLREAAPTTFAPREAISTNLHAQYHHHKTDKPISAVCTSSHDQLECNRTERTTIINYDRREEIHQSIHTWNWGWPESSTRWMTEESGGRWVVSSGHQKKRGDRYADELGISWLGLGRESLALPATWRGKLTSPRRECLHLSIGGEVKKTSYYS